MLKLKLILKYFLIFSILFATGNNVIYAQGYNETGDNPYDSGNDLNGDGVVDDWEQDYADNYYELDEVVVTASSSYGDGYYGSFFWFIDDYTSETIGDVETYYDFNFSNNPLDGSNGANSNLPPIPPQFNRVFSAEYSSSITLAIPVRKEIVSKVSTLIAAPVSLMTIGMPTADLSGIISLYNNKTPAPTQVSVSLVLNQISNVNPNTGQLYSTSVNDFKIWLEQFLIQFIFDESVEFDNIEFEDCNGDCWCSTSACGINWYLDVDNDGYHRADSPRTQPNNPGYPGDGWVQGTSLGEDCNDTNSNKTINCCPEGQIPTVNGGCIIDPCANDDLVTKVIDPNLRQQIESRTQTNPYPPHGQVLSFKIQDLDDGWGSNINIDNYTLNITSLPTGYTPFMLFNEIRLNFSQLMTGGDMSFLTDVTFEPYSTNDGIVWNSDNPLGAAMDFATFLDTSTVVCVEYSEEEMYWIFGTVFSWDHAGHFVSGLRQFGLKPNEDGGYSFYLRGADRLGGVLDLLGNGGSNDYLFQNAGDATWKNFMEDLEDFILDKPGGDIENFSPFGTYGARYPYVPGGCDD